MGGLGVVHLPALRPFLLVLCMALFLSAMAGCAAKSSPPPPAKPAAMHPASPKAAQLLRTARSLLGYPYAWGGHHPNTGFDCSGFTWFVFHHNGIDLPRVSWRQFATGTNVHRDAMRPGDLIFFRIDKKGKSLHTGIVTDRGTFIHAPSSGKEVMESPLHAPYWHEHYLGARRVF